MHRARKPKHRKMLKPKFCSSSDDDDDNFTSMKWKPNVASFPLELDKPKSIEKSPMIDSLNAKMANQQKLSAEIIQKEEIYNQAEMEANKKMFGCVNPGRCLSKDEIKRRRDIILQIVNERLKSKLSELMGEFGERIGMNGTNKNGRSDTTDDDDSLPEAPPPPTFNTSSESSESGDDLEMSFTKEFELYEKEIKEKTAQSNVATTTTTATTFSAPTNYQSNWQQSTTQQWSSALADVTPWIPPVGPPQIMEPFPPPIESEQMSLPFIQPPPILANGWIDPTATTAWVNPSPTTFAPNFNSVLQFPNTEWMNQQPQSLPPYRPAVPSQMNWNPRGHPPSSSFIRPATTQQQDYSVPNNVNASILSKSTYVNAILAAEQKVAPASGSGGSDETKVNAASSSNGKWNKFNKKMDNDSNSRKRPFEQQIDKIECANKYRGNVNNYKNSNGVGKPKKTRFDNPQHDYRFNSNHGTESTKQNGPSGVEFDARYEKKNAKTDKFLSNYRNAQSRNTGTCSGADTSMKDQTNVPIEWTKLCDIVDKLLDLSPNILKDLPLNDRRVKERNEVLMILSDDPRNFYAHIDKYGEQNVKWAIKMAKRILYPQGRYYDKIALAIAPFQKAIHVASGERPKTSSPTVVPKGIDNNKATIPTKQMSVPKEWKKLCEIVDNVLDIPTRVIEQLSPSDRRVKERNDILMLLSNDPEDFLLHDEKYGARNVDSAILAAKRILCPGGVADERVRNVMMRQREILTKCFFKSSVDRSISRDRESSRKRSNHKSTAAKADEHRSRSLPIEIPKEWNQLCDIVDKLLDTPKEVRIKMSKRDPRWEQRDEILLVLTDDPDKLESRAEELGRVNVEFAIKSSKKLLFPNGLKDRSIMKKLSPQRKLLLKNRQSETANEMSKQVKDENVFNGDDQPTANGIKEKRTDQKIKIETRQENGDVKNSKVEKISAVPQTNYTETQKSTPPTTSVAAASTEEIIDEKEAWLKLCSIVDKLLDLPCNAADKLDSTDKRLIERNDILMILSDDPENFSKFDSSYGSANVAWAIKSAKKLIYSNGRPNEQLVDALWKERDVIMCAAEGAKEEEKKDTTATGECNEWKCVRKIATKVFLLSCKSKKLTKEQLHQQIELLLQLSDDPEVVRSKPICKQIGEGRVEVAIAKCKHILNRMRKFDPKALLNFENLRSKMVLYSESLNQSKNIKNYNVILAEVRTIVDEKMFNEIYGPNFNKWTTEQKLERNELAILLIKDPLFLKTNEKYLEMVRGSGKVTVVDDIISDVEKCLAKCEYVKEAPVVVCAPIIARIRDEKLMFPYKQKRLIHRIHRLIEQFLVDPKPEVFDVCASSDGCIDVVCANAMTFDWLKKSINELDGLWNNAALSIGKAPVTRKVLDIDGLKEIKMMLKTVRNESFAEIMEQLKKSNSKLTTDKWQLSPSSSLTDTRKMFVMVDLESLVELEQSKREVNVENGKIYFDIQYIGEENF